MLIDITNWINEQIESRAPINGVLIGDINDATTWAIDFKNEASQQQIDDVNNFIATYASVDPAKAVAKKLVQNQYEQQLQKFDNFTVARILVEVIKYVESLRYSDGKTTQSDVYYMFNRAQYLNAPVSGLAVEWQTRAKNFIDKVLILDAVRDLTYNQIDDATTIEEVTSIVENLTWS